VTDARERLSIESFAKINRDLRVVGKRKDGFHELDTVFQTVDLTDTLTFEHVEKGAGTQPAFLSRSRARTCPPTAATWSSAPPRRFGSASTCFTAPASTFRRRSQSAGDSAAAAPTLRQP